MVYRYRTIKVAGRTKLLHRHVMERHLGRVLERGEHVHHVDGDPWNNAIANLEVKPAARHLSDHKSILPLTKACAVCGSCFAPAPTKRRRALTCSKQCADRLRSITERATKGRVAIKDGE